MKDKSHKRPKIGDIIEIITPLGRAYAQYTHSSKDFGSLIRILPGFYEDRPLTFFDIVNEQERFFIFFPLGAAVKRGIVHIVASENLPERVKPFPLMRMPGARNRSGRILNWWLWDGQHEWKLDELTPEQQQLSLAVIWNDTLLIERIVGGWSPSDEV